MLTLAVLVLNSVSNGPRGALAGQLKHREAVERRSRGGIAHDLSFRGTAKPIAHRQAEGRTAAPVTKGGSDG